MARVAPSERFGSELDEALAGVGQDQDPVETIGRLGARLILQRALEDEVCEFLGRRRYERAEETVSYRNGYEPRTVRTTAGPPAFVGSGVMVWPVYWPAARSTVWPGLARWYPRLKLRQGAVCEQGFESAPLAET